MNPIFAPDDFWRMLEVIKPTSTSDVLSATVMALGSAAYLFYGVPWDQPDPYHHLWFEKPQLDTASGEKFQRTRNIAEMLEESDKNMVIFWGSQSGTAETLANKLARECYLKFGLRVLVADVSDYDPETISEIPNSKLAIFILSTFGEGDPSDNAMGLWTWIRDIPQDKVRQLRYMAFGLGNSTYKYYNRVIEVVSTALDHAGANRLMPVGRADDNNNGTQEDFLAWKEHLFETFRTRLGLHEREISFTPAFEIIEDSEISTMEIWRGTPNEYQGGTSKGFTYYSAIKAVNIVSAEELYQTPERACMHLEFDLTSQPELRYKTGDHLVVYPINPDKEVQLLLNALGIDNQHKNKPLRINFHQGNSKIPSPTTIAALFTHYLDLCAPVSRDNIGRLAQFAPSAEAKSLLVSLSKSKEELGSYINQNHVTFGRLTSLVAPNSTWDQLPLSFILETVPLLQPRYYSISSSAITSARKLSITVGVDVRTLIEAPEVTIRGLASNYLLSVAASLRGAQSPWSVKQNYTLPGPHQILDGNSVFVCIRKSHFKLPTQHSTPIIMVAAGTGLAPFRGFILERARLKTVGKSVGPMVLFFGCRRPNHDFPYQEELSEAATTLGNLDIKVAFSRPDIGSKRYVQDIVKDEGSYVCQLLEKGANVYICGRAAMARDVGKIIQKAMAKYNNGDQLKGLEWSESMKKGKKWLEDVWG